MSLVFRKKTWAAVTRYAVDLISYSSLTFASSSMLFDMYILVTKCSAVVERPRDAPCH